MSDQAAFVIVPHQPSDGQGWKQWARRLSAEERARLADASGAPSVNPATLAGWLSSDDYLRRAIADLSPQAQDLLFEVWSAGGMLGLEHTTRWTDAMRGEAAGLGTRGLLVQLTIDYYRQAYAFPVEARRWITELIVAPRLVKRARRVPAAADVTLPANPVWLTDLFRCVSHARWLGAPLTQQGQLHKRWERAVHPLLWPEHPLAPEFRLNIAIGFALAAQLLTDPPGAAELVVTNNAPKFFSAPVSERWADWWRYFELHLISLPLGRDVVDCLWALPADRAVTAKDLASFLNAQRGQPPRQVVEGVDQVLRAGSVLGWVELDSQGLARLSANARALRAGRFAPEQPAHAIMEPTGDVMVPVETPLGELWAAEEVLSLQRSDVVWTYRCDTAARERAHERDLSSDDVVQRIQSLLATPMPDNVAVDIQDQFRHHLSVRVIEATVVTAGDATALPELKKILAPWVVEQLGERALLLAPGSGAKALARIKRAGLTSRHQVERAGQAVEAGGIATPRPVSEPIQPQWQVKLPAAEGQLAPLVLRSALGTGRAVRLHCRPGAAPAARGDSLDLVVHHLDAQTVHGIRVDVSPPQWITLRLDAIDQAQVT